MTQRAEDPFSHILKCIHSGSDFHSNSPTVFSFLSHNSKPYADQFLKDILLILNDAQYSPTSKFYTILLLLKATETSKAFLSSRLAKQKHLLDKIFKDAQFDKQKEFDHRGKKFFARNPTEELASLGINYVRLVLEAIVYWYQIFGTANTRDPLYIFTLIYNNLSTLVTLPQVFYYAGREINVGNRFHLQHFLTLTVDPISLEGNLKKKNEETEEEVNGDQTFNEVLACISSMNAFKSNSDMIFKSVAKNSWVYNKSLLHAVNGILVGTGYPPEFKFYALLLVVRLSETTNEIFMQHLGEERSLLENVLKNAQFDKDKPPAERGKTFFKMNPSPREAITGRNYVTLLRETVHFWATLAEKFAYGESKEGLARVGNSCIGLMSKIELTGGYCFVGKTLEDDMDPSLRKFSEETVKMNKGNKEKVKESGPNADLKAAEEHVKACLASEEGYRESIRVACNTLQLRKSSEYVKTLLKSVEQVLGSAERPKKEKFSALYLLVKMTEIQDQMLASQLESSQSLLEMIFAHAEEGLKDVAIRQRKGYMQTPRETEEDLFSSAYVRLVCEAIIWWSQVYGGQKEERRNQFSTLYEALLRNNKELPEEFMLINDKGSLTPLEAALRYAQAREHKWMQEEDGHIERLKENLSRLENVKERFKKALEENEEAIFRNMRIADSLMKELTQVYHKEVLLEANFLIDNNVVRSEKYVRRAVVEGDIFEKISKAYLDYKQQVLRYPWFRTEILGIFNQPIEDVIVEVSEPYETPRYQKQGDVQEKENEEQYTEDKNNTLEKEAGGEIPDTMKESEKCEGHVEKENTKDSLQDAWVYLSGEGSMVTKREISSILNADEEKGNNTPTRRLVYSPQTSDRYLKEVQINVENLVESSQHNESVKVDPCETGSKAIVHEAYGHEEEEEEEEEGEGEEREEPQERCESSSVEKSNVEEENEGGSKIDEIGSYQALMNEIKRLSKEKQEIFEENCQLRKVIAENKEQVKLDEASQALEDLRSILLEAQGEMERLYRELHKKNEEVKLLKRKCEKKDEEIRFYKENIELRGKVESLSNDLSELKKNMIERNNGAVREGNEELVVRLGELEKKNEGLTRLLEDIQAKNSAMCSKMHELEELQSTVTLMRQNTSRVGGQDGEHGLESRLNTARGGNENVKVEMKNGEQSEEGKQTGDNDVGVRGMKALDMNSQQIEELNDQSVNRTSKGVLSIHESPLRLISENVIQNENQEAKKERLSVESSPEKNGCCGQYDSLPSLGFIKRYSSVQVSGSFMPMSTQNQESNYFAVDPKKYSSQSSGRKVDTINLDSIYNNKTK